MSELLNIMANVILPVFMVLGAAVLIGKRFNPDPRPISVLLIYLFTPSLVFRGISSTELSGGELGGIAAVTIILALIMAGIGMLAVRTGVIGVARDDHAAAGAVILCLMMVNAANYGIPLNTFAFGEEGGERAIIYYVASIFVGNFMGVYFASLGRSSARDSLMNVARVPIAYAALIGLAFNVLGNQGGLSLLPLPLERAVDIAADAAIPGMLALLGIQLARIRFSARLLRPIILVTAGRLVLGAIIAVPLASFFGLTGVAFNVTVVQSAMPTAVMASALATEFGSDAELTSAVTLVSTLLSIITLSILITLLGGVSV